MHQFDKNTIVTFDPSSADSISQALSEYSRLLDSDKVMKPGRFENDFDIEASESDFADDPDRLVSEVEDFLRNHPGRN